MHGVIAIILHQLVLPHRMWYRSITPWAVISTQKWWHLDDKVQPNNIHSWVVSWIILQMGLGAALLLHCIDFLGVLWPSDVALAAVVEDFLAALELGWKCRDYHLMDGILWGGTAWALASENLFRWHLLSDFGSLSRHDCKWVSGVAIILGLGINRCGNGCGNGCRSVVDGS